MQSKGAIETATDFLRFVNASPTAYHCVATAGLLLKDAGFQMINERDSWKLEKGGKYYFTRNATSLVAFHIGSSYVQGTSPLLIVGAHTDSPALKIKVRSNIQRAGCSLASVETYGGGIWHTWFDRDLGISGRVLVRDGGKIASHLLTVNEPVMRVPSLAIHLDRSVNEAFKFNLEEHLTPLMSSVDNNSTEGSVSSKFNMGDGPDHASPLLNLIAQRLNIPASSIVDFDLNLHDVQPACLGGINKDFVFSPRIDNQLSCFCGVNAIVSSHDDSAITMLTLYDHEEIGSASAQGADSALTPDVVARVLTSLGCDAEDRCRTIARSFLLSCDCAHAVHPNYMEKHDRNLSPQMNKSIVIKLNDNQKYATNDLTMALVMACAERESIPCQTVMVKNDSPCGSTIGPILSSKLGIRTADIGCAQLSMHSIREQCGVQDVLHYCNIMKAFYNHFTKVDTCVDA